MTHDLLFLIFVFPSVFMFLIFVFPFEFMFLIFVFPFDLSWLQFFIISSELESSSSG